MALCDEMAGAQALISNDRAGGYSKLWSLAGRMVSSSAVSAAVEMGQKVAIGRVTVKLSGVPMCEIEDNTHTRVTEGPLALMVKATQSPAQVQFKDIRLKRMD